MAMNTYFYSAKIYDCDEMTGAIVCRVSGTVAISNDRFNEDLGQTIKNWIVEQHNATSRYDRIQISEVHLTALNLVY